jgi:hypothetical protein
MDRSRIVDRTEWLVETSERSEEPPGLLVERMVMTSVVRWWLALGLLIAVASGCSSSTHAASTSSATSTPSRSSSTVPAATQLQSICQQSDARLADAARHAFGSGQPSVEEWRPFMLQTVLPIIVDRLDAMGRSTAAAQVPSIAQAVDAGRAAVAAAQKDPAQLEPGTRAPFDRYDDLVAAAGLADCAVGG